MFLASKEFEPKGVLENESERWYKFPYENAKFSEELQTILREHECPDNGLNLDLPPPNVLLPKNFDILPENAVFSSYPKLIKQWPECDLWYKQDDKFKLPKAKLGAKIYTNDCGFGKTTTGTVFTYLWEGVLSEYLREFDYMGSCASLSFSITVAMDNIDLGWSGYNDSMPEFVSGLFERMQKMSSDELAIEHNFNQIKEKLTQDWKNSYLQQTYLQSYH